MVSLFTINSVGNHIQIQHLLKLNFDWFKGNAIKYRIQIQHLLKLNVATVAGIERYTPYSNTTLVKVKLNVWHGDKE